jgi:hypothetical protein
MTKRAISNSKPNACINLEVYGVKIRGVTIFADVALRSMGIDPNCDPCTATTAATCA